MEVEDRIGRQESGELVGYRGGDYGKRNWRWEGDGVYIFWNM